MIRIAFPILTFLFLSINLHAQSPAPYHISPSDPASLQRGIEAAYKAGEKSLKIPVGTYKIDEYKNSSCLYLKDMKDFKIDFSGCTILAKTNKKFILFMDKCDNVTIQGGTFGHITYPFSQGKIEAIAQDRKSFDVRIPKGYPTNIDDPDFAGRAPKIMGLFDAQTRDWVRGAGDIWYTQAERLGPDLFRFQLRDTLAENYPITAGNLVAWRGFDVGALILFHCQNMKMIGVTVISAGGFTIAERFGEGKNYYHGCSIIRGPAPEGADKNETPLFSSACDGYHSTSVRNGPTYEKCYVEYNDDDGFAIHGHGALVMESKGNTLIVGQRDKEYSFRIGDTLRLYDENGAWVTDAKVTALTPMPNYTLTQTLPKEFRDFNNSISSKRMTFEEVKVDKAVSIPFSGIAVDSNTTGNGYAIRDCKVYHNRERGMLIKASNGIIENCIVDGPTVGGIVFVPEVGYWDEVDFIRNVTIRNNLIRNVGLWSTTMGALVIGEHRWKGPVPLPGGHQDILVEGNTFEMNDGVNIAVFSAQRVNFQKNKFIKPMQKDKRTAWGISPSESLYWISESKDISIQENEIIQAGSLLKSVVKTTESTSNIKQ